MATIKLKDISTRAPKEFNKQDTKQKLEKILDELDELQNLLYAEGKHSVLVVLQGVDASGKDSTIRHVFGKLNPLGVSAHPFKVPTPEELAHDFLWRVHKLSPAKGTMAIFNRSHYEDVLVTRVHGWCDDETAKKRMEAINGFEKLLSEHNNTQIFKFYLHISKEEQSDRLDERIRDPRKQWKYNQNDFEESDLWERYRKMYEAIFEHCDEPPWKIIPADQKWYRDYLVAITVRDALEKLSMKYPSLKE